MSLVDRINNDLKEAMKAKDKDKLMALRAIKSALLMAQTEKGATGDISEDAELRILQKQLKQRRESAELYKTQGRDDLYEKEAAEAAIIEQYMPQMMSPEELKAAIASIIADLGASGMQDMGRVMGVASKQLAGKAEGRDISTVVKQLLA